MGYRNLQECVADLESVGELKRITQVVDPYLEIAAIQRLAYERNSPALLFTNVANCKFPILTNLFGTKKRAHYIFRDTLENLSLMIKAKADPQQFLRKPWQGLKLLPSAWHTRANLVNHAAVCENKITISELPQIVSWPKDGGPFITLPQVYTEDVTKPGWQNSNLGMYRVQLAGNKYQQNEQIGLHYQTHRSIGVHHERALQTKKPLRVNIFVGGTPAMSLAAVMPLPEGLSEIMFGGALAGHRIPLYQRQDTLPIYAEADFCITGFIEDGLLPEGPFGDHLGYYSLQHDFPVMRVEHVFHRQGAIWPYTCVGRPPQEDTMFGELIHEITGPMIPAVMPGVHAVHAVDAAGVHPLLFAIGSERYAPYAETKRPMELLTQANAILGQGQLSLAKYLFISAHQDAPTLNVKNEADFLQHMLQRVDWRRDLHFQTCTTIDTLDYSGSGLNEGSKVVIAAVGNPIRTLATSVLRDLNLPDGFAKPTVCLPGVLAVTASQGANIANLLNVFKAQPAKMSGWPLIVLVDDSEFAAKSLHNFMWITFTRSNPAHDIYGVNEFTDNKHWGCHGSLIIDARSKKHHAPVLEEDPNVTKKVESMGIFD